MIRSLLDDDALRRLHLVLDPFGTARLTGVGTYVREPVSAGSDTLVARTHGLDTDLGAGGLVGDGGMIDGSGRAWVYGMVVETGTNLAWAATYDPATGYLTKRWTVGTYTDPDFGIVQSVGGVQSAIPAPDGGIYAVTQRMGWASTNTLGVAFPEIVHWPNSGTTASPATSSTRNNNWCRIVLCGTSDVYAFHTMIDPSGYLGGTVDLAHGFPAAGQPYYAGCPQVLFWFAGGYWALAWGQFVSSRWNRVDPPLPGDVTSSDCAALWQCSGSDPTVQAAWSLAHLLAPWDLNAWGSPSSNLYNDFGQYDWASIPRLQAITVGGYSFLTVGMDVTDPADGYIAPDYYTCIYCLHPDGTITPSFSLPAPAVGTHQDIWSGPLAVLDGELYTVTGESWYSYLPGDTATVKLYKLTTGTTNVWTLVSSYSRTHTAWVNAFFTGFVGLDGGLFLATRRYGSHPDVGEPSNTPEVVRWDKAGNTWAVYTSVSSGDVTTPAEMAQHLFLTEAP
jgi:hypothetical protein